MKYITYLFIVIATLMTVSAQAQKKTTAVKVWGNCGMCKAKIDKAAIEAGADKADWNTETKMLNVVYNEKKTDIKKIQKAIAGVGYDNEAFTASNEVYEKLHSCCKYERKDATTAKAEKCSADCKCPDCKEKGKCENCTGKEKCEGCKSEAHHVNGKEKDCCDSKIAA
ncbi:heavy-metal-associated domain-containing protein [Gynurincola endophyticus]|uniref:heavy-metal-associated domain-containing protein n=1 Tax=Gynurincola endophyticus TaxID=2479004 RepID=UPI001F340BED|nr:cation transporter [Gynurincola endophyticus]